MKVNHLGCATEGQKDIHRKLSPFQRTCGTENIEEQNKKTYKSKML